jgi:hypothetical protein
VDDRTVLCRDCSFIAHMRCIESAPADCDRRQLHMPARDRQQFSSTLSLSRLPEYSAPSVPTKQESTPILDKRSSQTSLLKSLSRKMSKPGLEESSNSTPPNPESNSKAKRTHLFPRKRRVSATLGGASASDLPSLKSAHLPGPPPEPKEFPRVSGATLPLQLPNYAAAETNPSSSTKSYSTVAETIPTLPTTRAFQRSINPASVYTPTDYTPAEYTPADYVYPSYTPVDYTPAGSIAARPRELTNSFLSPALTKDVNTIDNLAIPPSTRVAKDTILKDSEKKGQSRVDELADLARQLKRSLPTTSASPNAPSTQFSVRQFFGVSNAPTQCTDRISSPGPASALFASEQHGRHHRLGRPQPAVILNKTQSRFGSTYLASREFTRHTRKASRSIELCLYINNLLNQYVVRY